MADVVSPSESLEGVPQQSSSAATQNAPPRKTFRQIIQSTLMPTGLSREWARDEPISPTSPTGGRKGKEGERQNLREETKRALKLTFMRKSKPTSSGDAKDVEERPFMGSLRHASMSSPVLPIFSNPVQSSFSSSADPGSPTAGKLSPARPRQYTRRSSTSRDSEKEPISSSQISRPRVAQPASPSSPTFSQYPTPAPSHSPPRRMTRFPSVSMSNLPPSSAQRTTSPTFQTRNTSTAPLSSSSPPREAIRTASSLLVKHLLRPPPNLRQGEWNDVEVRLRALSRLERLWGKSSSTTAVGSGPTLGGGEEREKRLFCEAVRDGYVLCVLLNKFRPGTVARPDPKEDGFAKTSNVTKFLAGALHYGVSNADLFMRNDLLEATSESLSRVAQTIIALVRLGEPTPQASGNIYMSSPNLPDSGSRSPYSRPEYRRRYSPPSPVRRSSSGKPITPTSAPNTPRQKQAGSASIQTPYFVHKESSGSSNAPLIAPLSPPRSSTPARASIASGMTGSTGFSDQTHFGTVRTSTTVATSIYPSETPSLMGTRRDSKTRAEQPRDQSEMGYQARFTKLPITSRRSYDRESSAARLAAAPPSASLDASPTRPWRTRRSSDVSLPDLGNVEEVDEMGTRRGRPFAAGMGADWSLLTPTSVAAVSPIRPSVNRSRVSFEDQPDSRSTYLGYDSPASLSNAKTGVPMRRPGHGHRTSVDTGAVAPAPLPVARHSSLSRERGSQPSPSSSRAEVSPSSPIGGSRPLLVPRRSTSRTSPRPTYVPKLSNADGSRQRHSEESTRVESALSGPVIPRVPFPRSTSGDISAQEATATGSANGSSHNFSPHPNVSRPIFARGRYNSEQDNIGAQSRKQQPNSLDDGGARPRRARYESMVNLGKSGEAPAGDSSLSISAVRMPLIVREEGKPPIHYQIGNGIGRGQFGAVYRALNLNTGQMVAVKRIDLRNLSEEEVLNLMKEVDVLKRLSHPSIVKYEGMVRSADTLSIVLEYVENGSLGQTLRAFGKLNERLVASYVIKILEGLRYLHMSHVVHCDLKAANILTTKNGNVKLSDFGVSLNLHAKALEEIKNDVAGTPNWMAPEVIELKGPSTASDIWSLGCTTIELLTGHPPYHEIHNGLSVMFRIIEDDSPPIPEACSPLMIDFLKQCFKKNPTERPSAETLFDHAWLKTAFGEQNELRSQDSIPFLNRVYTDLARTEARSLSVDTKFAEAGPNFPSAPTTALSPTFPDVIMRNHSFIKTTFSRAVQCRVCLQSVKRSAVLCEECSLISHARCAADAPANCDIRTQLLLYSQYSQSGTAQDVSTPTYESASLAGSAPTPISSSPGMSPRKRRPSGATLSTSPKLSERVLNWGRRVNKSPEPASPPLSAVSGSSIYGYHPPQGEAPPPSPGTSAVRPSTLLASSSKAGNMRQSSQISLESTTKTDNTKGLVTVAETVSTSSHNFTSQPFIAQPALRRPLPMSSVASASTQHAGTLESTTPEASRLNTQPPAVPANISDEYTRIYEKMANGPKAVDGDSAYRQSYSIQLVALNLQISQTSIVIDENATFCQVGAEIYSTGATVIPVALEQTCGPTPQWSLPDIDTRIPRYLRKLYVADISIPFTLASVRNGEEDVPLLIPIQFPNTSITKTVGEAVGPCLSGRATTWDSIKGISDSRDVENLAYDLFWKDTGGLYSTIFSVLLNDETPATHRSQLRSDHDFPTPLPLRLIIPQCRMLVLSAPRLKAFALQAIHLSRSLLHLTICLAEAVTQSAIEGAIEAYLISRLQSLVNRLKTLFAYINDSTPRTLEDIEESLKQFFYDLCEEQPGVVPVRQSFESFSALGLVNRRDGSMSDASSESDVDTHTEEPAGWRSIIMAAAERRKHEFTGSSDSLTGSERGSSTRSRKLVEPKAKGRSQVDSGNPADSTEPQDERRRIKRRQLGSSSSKDAQCVIQ